MDQCFTKSSRRLPLNHLLRPRFLYLVTCSLALTLLWMQVDHKPDDIDSLIQEALDNVAKDFRYSEVLRKHTKLSKDIKYILLWTRYDYAPFSFFEKGQRSFIKNNCSAINCYVTTNSNFFNDITKFHAIAFNGRTMSADHIPKVRSPHQKYIYVNTESADNYPVCDSKFDNFFNWTATYKLDSDIPSSYIIIKNKQGGIVGPRVDMHWPQKYPDVDDDLHDKLLNKTKAAAWFVSHCSSKSGRDEVVKKLQKALELYGLTVDVYGACGPLKCSPHQRHNCDLMLEKDYFFYMALENTLAEDYVTEKLLTAMLHDTVPIVFGGANYSRYLPPDSYIDANKYSPIELASLIDQYMRNQEVYSQFFKWRGLYTYSNPIAKENICALCAALNDEGMLDSETVYKHFRKWWHPNYIKVC